MNRFETQRRWQWHWQSGQPAPSWAPWFGLIFLLAGLAMLGAGFWQYQGQAAFAQSAASASGTVTDLVRQQRLRRDSQGSVRDEVFYAPVVQFTDRQGRMQTLHAASGSNPPAYRRGDTVAVLYDPANPEIAVIDGWQRYLPVLVLAGLGAVFALVGLGVLGRVWQQRSKPQSTADLMAQLNAQAGKR